MSRKRFDSLIQTLRDYAESRTLELTEFTDIHTRLTDGYTVMDIWPTTGRYYILSTNYADMTTKPIVERGGEKGFVPLGKNKIFDWLDIVFFAPDFSD